MVLRHIPGALHLWHRLLASDGRDQPDCAQVQRPECLAEAAHKCVKDALVGQPRQGGKVKPLANPEQARCQANLERRPFPHAMAHHLRCWAHRRAGVGLRHILHRGYQFVVVAIAGIAPIAARTIAPGQCDQAGCGWGQSCGVQLDLVLAGVASPTEQLGRDLREDILGTPGRKIQLASLCQIRLQGQDALTLGESPVEQQHTDQRFVLHHSGGGELRP